MTVEEIENVYPGDIQLPSRITGFLDAVDRYVEQHRVNTSSNYAGFVPSDYQMVYQHLKYLYESSLLSGERFCEWGSGVGVVASLAAMIGYESFGIEYNEDLVVVAEKIREEFGIPVELIQGSFVPPGTEKLVDEAFASQEGELSLYVESDRTYSELGYDAVDFDLFFCFPWPTDIDLTLKMFEHHAAQGALMLLYYSTESMGLYRKV